MLSYASSANELSGSFESRQTGRSGKPGTDLRACRGSPKLTSHNSEPVFVEETPGTCELFAMVSDIGTELVALCLPEALTPIPLPGCESPL